MEPADPFVAKYFDVRAVDLGCHRGLPDAVIGGLLGALAYPMVGALTIIISALQSGLLGRTTMGTLSQIRGLAGHLGIFPSRADVKPSGCCLLKAAMATGGNLDYSAHRGQITRIQDPEWSVYCK